MKQPRKKRSFRRAIAFRCAAVLLGLAPLFLFELGLRLAKWKSPRESGASYVEFSQSHPLFELNETSGRMETADSRLEYFVRDSFDAKKKENEFRIFVLGGSTVQGRPYSIETSFTTWLELRLRAAQPDREWPVVNCGGVSYGTVRLRPIMHEVLRFEPDLIILYTGHNEFLETGTLAHIRSQPAAIRWGHDCASNLKTYQFGRWMWTDESTGGAISDEVDAALDHVGGFESYRRSEVWVDQVIENFRVNLTAMLDAAKQHDVPILLANPVCKLRDNPPFKSEAVLDSDDRHRFESEWQAARKLIATHPEKALDRLDDLRAQDNGHAGVAYDFALCADQLGATELAESAYERAKNNDVCPLRILSRMRLVIDDVAKRFDVPLVDVDKAFAQRSRDGIVGQQMMLDHVHPTIDGHQLIATLFFDELVSQGFAKIDESQRWKVRVKFEAHLRSLNFAYFERGRQRLEGLKIWTKSRVVSDID